MVVSQASENSVAPASPREDPPPPPPAPTAQQGTQDGRTDGAADGDNCTFKGKSYRLHKAANGKSQYKGNYEAAYKSSYEATCDEGPEPATPNTPTAKQGTQDGRTDGAADGDNCTFKGKSYRLHKAANGKSQYQGNYEAAYKSSFEATCDEE
ncbi:hypothetical protein ACIOZL_17800 [Streptomyces sp. NPDC087769]|uniref:hypothetical protein n=1 Tax=Streptomyces sp. NPDC087769 TaxID=3365802 RepID=UPI0037F57AD5